MIPDGGCGCATWDGRAMADEEREALRKQRLAELQAKHGVSGRAAGAPPVRAAPSHCRLGFSLGFLFFAVG